MENFSIEWRVSPLHAHLLQASAQVPNLPIATVAPSLHDVIQLQDGTHWVIWARLWEPVGDTYKLVFLLNPANNMPDMSGMH